MIFFLTLFSSWKYSTSPGELLICSIVIMVIQKGIFFSSTSTIVYDELTNEIKQIWFSLSEIRALPKMLCPSLYIAEHFIMMYSTVSMSVAFYNIYIYVDHIPQALYQFEIQPALAVLCESFT